MGSGDRRFDSGPTSEDTEPTFEHGGYGFGIGLAFLLLDSIVECGRGVVVEDRDGLLDEDGTGIDPFVDEVHCATGDFDAMIQRLFPGIQPGKGRQQGWMDVEHASGKSAEESGFQDAHEAGEQNEIDAGVVEGSDVGPLRVVVELGSKRARRQESGGDATFPGAVENSGVWHVGQDQCDLGGDASGGASLGDGDEVRAFARTEDTEAEGRLMVHACGLPTRRRACDKREFGLGVANTAWAKRRGRAEARPRLDQSM
jgi:hypothetical protein